MSIPEEHHDEPMFLRLISQPKNHTFTQATEGKRAASYQRVHSCQKKSVLFLSFLTMHHILDVNMKT